MIREEFPASKSHPARATHFFNGLPASMAIPVGRVAPVGQQTGVTRPNVFLRQSRPRARWLTGESFGLADV